MSHGAENKEAEPNLTPLLDVVLQLIMFFMMCVNFTQEQATQDVKLPSAEAAKPLDAAETDVLYVNLKPYHLSDYEEKASPEMLAKLKRDFPNEGAPMVIVVGKDPMRPIDALQWLKQKYKDLKAELLLKNPREASPSVKTIIILRASKDMACDQVYQIMSFCTVAGFREVRLRAQILQQPKQGA